MDLNMKNTRMLQSYDSQQSHMGRTNPQVDDCRVATEIDNKKAMESQNCREQSDDRSLLDAKRLRIGDWHRIVGAQEQFIDDRSVQHNCGDQERQYAPVFSTITGADSEGVTAITDEYGFAQKDHEETSSLSVLSEIESVISTSISDLTSTPDSSNPQLGLPANPFQRLRYNSDHKMVKVLKQDLDIIRSTRRTNSIRVPVQITPKPATKTPVIYI